MLYVDAKELREKGSIILLQDGAIVEAINEETMKVLDDIENLKADPTAKRVITPKITLISNPSRTQIGVECSIDTKLAPKKVMNLTLDLGKAVDDEGRLIGYQLKEHSEQAEGQQTINGDEVKKEVITIPNTTDAIDAEYTEKSNEADTDEKLSEDTETQDVEENAAIEPAEGTENESSGWTANEITDGYYAEPEVPEYPSPNVDCDYDH